MKRLLALALILGLAQLTYAQKDKKEGLKKIGGNTDTAELAKLGELAELASLAELTALSSLSELSELSSLTELSELSELAVDLNTGILIEMDTEWQTMVEELTQMSLDISIEAINQSVDVDQINKQVKKVVDEALEKN